MEKLLIVNHLTKKYGSHSVLEDVNFSVDAGKVIGVVGRNGSGKTTLFKILAGLTSFNSGDISILGNEIGIKTKSIVSFMSDHPDFEKWQRIKDAMKFYSCFYPDYNGVKMQQILEWMELDENQKINGLSRGTREKLHLALALSRDAKLYILDEPITGVDPVIRDKILDAIVKFYNEDSSILISTHFITEIERLFDEILVLKGRTVILHENAEDVRIKYGNSLEQWAKEMI